jgi:hypothetical protein
MSQGIPVNLPIRIQSIRIPVRWKLDEELAKDGSHVHQWLNGELATKEKVEQYDPWEKRNEFFRLKRGDTASLLSFLGSVGLWDRPEDEDPSWRHEGSDDEEQWALSFAAEGGAFNIYNDQCDRTPDEIWAIRENVKAVMRGKRLPQNPNFLGLNCRFVFGNPIGPYLLITTLSFLEALYATALIDRASGLGVQKCARPDCGIAFPLNSRHRRKFCSPNCAHLECVRRSRRRSLENAASSEGR